ncbi:MAG TPA: hypothetical protein PLJ60_14870 [Chryseolinea sp.]|nr:hypothetical protein [Chryseolinea sp.]
MGKRTIKTNHFNVKARLDPHALLKDDRLYVNIRCTPNAKGKDKKYKQTDVYIYLQDGVRLKAFPIYWSDDEIKGGYEAYQLIEINERIRSIQLEVSHYAEQHPNATKQVFEKHLYGESLKSWQKQRIKYLDVPVFKNIPTDLYNELRATNLKEKIITTEKVTKVEGEFKVIAEEKVERIIDPLSLDDFPKQLNPEIYQRFKNEFLENPDLKLVSRYHDMEIILSATYANENDRIDDLMKIVLPPLIRNKLYEKKTEYVRIDKTVLNEYQKRLKKGFVYDPEIIKKFNIDTSEVNERYILKLKDEVEQSQKDYRKSLLSVDQKFELGEFDKDNIFQIFICGFYTKFPNQINKPSILWRLLEYKANVEPPSHVKDFSVEWSKSFLHYIFRNGVKDTNFRGVDPTNITKDTFKGKRIFYTKDRYADVLKWYKDAVNKLSALKRLPLIDLKQINIKEFYTQSELKNIDTLTQDEKFITKPELDELLKFNFSTDELNLTRDRFILLLMFGGLRINEFRPDKVKTGGSLHIEEDGYGGKYVAYYTSHNQKLKEMANPINNYTDLILKKYDYQIPFYTSKIGKSCEPNESHFNKSLKLMAKEIGIFKRRVKDKQRDAKGEMTTVKISIEDDFSSLYARHSIYPIFKFKEMPKELIMTFVGHSGKRDSSNHYDPKLFKDVAYKRKLIDKYGIKPD